MTDDTLDRDIIDLTNNPTNPAEHARRVIEARCPAELEDEGAGLLRRRGRDDNAFSASKMLPAKGLVLAVRDDSRLAIRQGRQQSQHLPLSYRS